MRAYEFIGEAKSRKKSGKNIVKNRVKPHYDQEAVMPGAHRVAGTADRTYDLNRIMMLVASTDGDHCEHVPLQSWAGKNNTAHPYTKHELKMLKHAYKLAGAEWDDILDPNLENKSIEPVDTHKTSPIKGFSGY